ncbi:MAG: hypothetical protein KGR26_01315 [Cyanobacteria bacterium REEB65]|nr:hypothetical protein [Cyanobacteria bacterium REEB65]
MTDVRDVPVFINCRDRVTELRGMVAWLEAAGQRRITLLDNASTYPPLLDYFRETSAEVVHLGANLGHLALFSAGLVPSEPFYYSDPDLVFLGPHEGLDQLREVSAMFPDRDKVGFGLSLEGVPEDMPNIAWERELWSQAREIAPGVFDAPLDTTFAYYARPTQDIWRALRIGEPCTVRHSPWYRSGPSLTEEDRYYLDHVEGRSCSWKGWVKT